MKKGAQHGAGPAAMQMWRTVLQRYLPVLLVPEEDVLVTTV